MSLLQLLPILHDEWLLSTCELCRKLGCLWRLPQERFNEQEVQNLQAHHKRCQQRRWLPIQQQLSAVHHFWVLPARELCWFVGFVWGLWWRVR